MRSGNWYVLTIEWVRVGRGCISVKVGIGWCG